MFDTDTSVFWVYFIRICAQSSDDGGRVKELEVTRVVKLCMWVVGYNMADGTTWTRRLCVSDTFSISVNWKRRQTFDICREQTYSMSATWCSYRTDEHRRRVIKMAAVLFRVSLADTEHWLHTIISSEPDFITSLHSVFPPPALNPRLHQLTAETQPGKYTRWKSAVWFSQRN